MNPQISTLPAEICVPIDIPEGKLNTRKSYEYGIKEFFSFLEFPLTIDSCRRVTREHVIAYRAWLESNEKSNSTINSRLSALSKLFNSLIPTYLRIDPMLKIIRPDPPKTFHSAVLSFDDAQKLLAACVCKNPVLTARNQAIVTLGLIAGLRREEFLFVTKNCIRTLTIGGRDYHSLRLPRSKSGECEIDLADQAYLALWRYIIDYESAYGPLPEKTCVFRALPQNGIGAGEIMHYNTIYMAIKIACRRAGLDPAKYHPHSLRHTCATWSVIFGKNAARPQYDVENETQRLMRHRDPRTTKKYIHLVYTPSDNIAALIPNLQPLAS